MSFLKKYKHYIPLVLFASAQILFNIIDVYALRDGNVRRLDWLYALIQLGLGISFVYTLTEEAKKFQKKGKYDTVYRLMFGAGFTFCAFLFSILWHLFDLY
ncbi:MAG: hypothetical protein LBG15_11410 [Dysgonamonadaceae bacterium]|jgi:hypothetical protein|nr:hypothetical protein [Dysgonamonadaceae bacterium]